MPRAPPDQPVLERGAPGVRDVHGDGSLLKLVKKEARARHKDRPGDGDEVTIHKRGWLAADPSKICDDTRQAGQKPDRFALGGGGAIQGLQEACATMRRGEVAWFAFGPERGFGAEGSQPHVPGHAGLVYEVELIRFSYGSDVSPEQDGSLVIRRVARAEGDRRPRGFVRPGVASTIEFDYELWVGGARGRPAGRTQLANVGAVWKAHEREKKAGFPKGIRVALENVFQRDLTHVTMYGPAAEGFCDADVPEGGAVEALVVLRDWHERVDCFPEDPGMVTKLVTKPAGKADFAVPGDADTVVVRGVVTVAGQPNTYACTYGDVVDITDGRMEEKTADEKQAWLRGAPSTQWMLDEEDKGTPVGAYDDNEPPKPLCRGVDVAVRSMTLGERARIYIDKAYGYQADGPLTEDSIPRCAQNVDLVADLELHDLKKLPEMWEVKNRKKLDHCDDFRRKGDARFRAGDYRRAIRRYDRAEEVAKSDTYMTDDELAELRAKRPHILRNRAAAHLKIKNYREAANDARVALQNDPHDVKALFRHGHSCLKLDDLDAARASLSKLLALDPGKRRARVDLDAVDAKARAAAAKTKAIFGGYLDAKE